MPPLNPHTSADFRAAEMRNCPAKTGCVAEPACRRVGVAILHPNRSGAQLEKCRLDHRGERLARVAEPTGGGQQHESGLDAVFVPRRRSQRAKAEAAAGLAFGNDEKAQVAGLARRRDRRVKARARLRARQRTADMAHDGGIAVQRAEQGQVAPRQRTQAQARGEDHSCARANRSRRASVLTSGSSLHAGGITTVSATAMSMSASRRSAMRSIRGASMGKVAAR